MPLSTPAPREHPPTRQIECQGFQRTDGLWDIEAHMTDRKSYSFPSDERGEVTAGTPIHDMCPAITPNFQRLVGLRIGPGFNARVREQLGGTEGCTHLVELMGPLATTA